MLGDIISNKVLMFYFKASEITCDIVLSAIEKLLQGKTKDRTGKQSLKYLRKKGTLQLIEVTDDTLKKLNKYLKKYNIDYSILKEKTDDKKYSLFFRNYDAELLEKVMKTFLKDRFKQKESIKDKINNIKQKSCQKTQDEKIKQVKKERKSRYEEL